MPSVSSLLSFSSIAALAAARPHKPLKRDGALPDFALKYAPHAYLHSQEAYWPSDIKTHLENVIPEVNFSALADAGSVTLATLNTYNSSVYLTANGDPSSDPSLPWITSDYGKPDNTTGLSGAPGTIIAVNKNETITDVFYFTFFSYNYGGK